LAKKVFKLLFYEQAGVPDLSAGYGLLIAQWSV
jgi:hypothetical protein